MKAKDSTKIYCRFCGNGKTLLLYKSNLNSVEKVPAQFACTNCGFGLHGPIVKCGHCKIIYVDDKISQEKISSYYQILEDPLYFSEQKARELTFKNYLKKLNQNFPNKGKLLDIGTNTGLFVKLALDSGWQAQGLEPNRWAVKFAKDNYGITVINKPFEKELFPKESFDVITMWDVIEHFTDPISALEKVHYFLKPGGVFAFSTVDPSSLLAKIMGTKWSWYMEMHRVFLDIDSAKYYLHKTKFRKTVFQPHFRKLSLGYFATRLQAVNPVLANIAESAVKLLHISKTIVPYYANDLYDCYAYK